MTQLKDQEQLLKIDENEGKVTYNNLIDRAAFLILIFIVFESILLMVQTVLFMVLPRNITSNLSEITDLLCLISYVAFLIFLFKNYKECSRYYKIIRWVEDPFRFTEDVKKYRRIDYDKLSD